MQGMMNFSNLPMDNAYQINWRAVVQRIQNRFFYNRAKKSNPNSI